MKPAAVKSLPAHHEPKSLAAIDADDDPLTELEDDTPISATLGKRSRTPTSGTIDGHSRPARRLVSHDCDCGLEILLINLQRATASRKIHAESQKVKESSKTVRENYILHIFSF